MSSGRIRRYRTLMAGLRSEIGLYEVPSWRGSPALGIGIITACFQITGILADRSERLQRCVRYWNPRGPSCSRWWIFSLSGPGAEEFLHFVMVLSTIAGLKRRDAMVEWVVSVHVSPESACGWVGLVAYCSCELLTEARGYLIVICVGTVVELDWLVGGCALFLAREFSY